MISCINSRRLLRARGLALHAVINDLQRRKRKDVSNLHSICLGIDASENRPGIDRGDL